MKDQRTKKTTTYYLIAGILVILAMQVVLRIVLQNLETQVYVVEGTLPSVTTSTNDVSQMPRMVRLDSVKDQRISKEDISAIKRKLVWGHLNPRPVGILKIHSASNVVAVCGNGRKLQEYTLQKQGERWVLQ